MDYKEKVIALLKSQELSKEQKEKLENIFPELKESEDERIRKFLIEDIKDTLSSEGFRNYNPEYTENLKEALTWLEKQGNKSNIFIWNNASEEPEEMQELLLEWESEDATWHEVGFYHQNDKTYWDGERKIDNVTRWCYIEELLEKQGEQKPADKVEPKFKVGDWIIFTAGELSTTLQIVNVDTNKKLYWFNDSSYLPIVNEECLHHWTIQDAKDGDILADKYNNIGISQKCEGICWHSYIYLGCDGELRGFYIGGSHEQTDTHPATKEQRDILFEKMKEAGYEWDDEKKELKKIEQKAQRMISAEAKEAMYGKPAWSEEDNKWIESLIQTFEDGYIEVFNQLKSYGVIDWLKSLKQRIGG